MLLAMQYKTFVWVNNPKSYTLSCERLTAAHKIPLAGYCVQDLGRSCTVLRGEGEFFGAGAYTQFRRLMEVFRSPGAGALRHPVWQCSRAYFTRLELAQEPREDYVACSRCWRITRKFVTPTSSTRERSCGSDDGMLAALQRGGCFAAAAVGMVHPADRRRPVRELFSVLRV